ncbi:MAG: CDP-alcohol phosphatidyltransferase family protein [Acidimicrobiales bacterium]
MFDGYWRSPVERVVDPLGATLHRWGVTANLLTVIGVLTAAIAAVAIGSGRLQLGFLLLVVAALPDLLDGPVAKAAGPPSRRGAFFDSTADRVTDTLLLAGVVWYLEEGGGHLGMLGVAIMGVSWLISYQRAKAESLGFDAKGGIMERAERIIALGIGLAIPPLFEPMLWIMLVLSTATAVQRFAKVWKQATIQLTATDMDRSH